MSEDAKRLEEIRSIALTLNHEFRLTGDKGSLITAGQIYEHHFKPLLDRFAALQAENETLRLQVQGHEAAATYGRKYLHALAESRDGKNYWIYNCQHGLTCSFAWECPACAKKKIEDLEDESRLWLEQLRQSEAGAAEMREALESIAEDFQPEPGQEGLALSEMREALWTLLNHNDAGRALLEELSEARKVVGFYADTKNYAPLSHAGGACSAILDRGEKARKWLAKHKEGTR